MQPPAPDWIATIKDVVGIIAPIVTAIIAGWGLWIARAGLKKWQTEEPGKRKLAVAEEALRLTYAVQQALFYVRGQHIDASELVTERGGLVVEISGHEARLNRYASQIDLFKQFRDHRALYGVYFGREAMSHFDEIFRLVNEIIIDIEDLRDNDGRPTGPEERDRLNKIRQKINYRSEKEDFDRRFDCAIAKMQGTFEQAVSGERRKRGVQ